MYSFRHRTDDQWLITLYSFSFVLGTYFLLLKSARGETKTNVSNKPIILAKFSFSSRDISNENNWLRLEILIHDIALDSVQ